MFKQSKYSQYGELLAFLALDDNNIATGNGLGLSCVLTTSNNQDKTNFYMIPNMCYLKNNQMFKVGCFEKKV